MALLLQIEDLRTHIEVPGGPVRAVQGVSFDVAAGEVVGLVGESGSGKTMTGMSVLRLLPPSARVVGGSVRFNGRELTSLPERQMRSVRGGEIGVVFQDPMTSLNPNMTIGAQISESVRVHLDASKRAARERVLEVLDLVGVPHPDERVRDYPHQLSGGLRQRIMIAMALSCNPRLLIADEPTTALDVTIQAQILELLEKLASTLSMGLVLITHDLGVIAETADKVVVMYGGRVAEVATTRELFKKTRHPYTEALLSAIPDMKGDPNVELAPIPGSPPDLRVRQKGCCFAARCAYADDECRSTIPELRLLEGTHRCACLKPRGNGEQDAPEDGSSGRSRGVAVSVSPRMAEGGDEASEAALVVLENVWKYFAVGRSRSVVRGAREQVAAVSGVSIRISAGETLGLVGESGCGKSTLGRIAVALEHPTSGSVVFDKQDLSQLKPSALRLMRRQFQFMFQDPYASLDPRMRIGEIVEEPLTVQGIGTRAERRERAATLLREVGLGREVMVRHPHEFSGGQRQRVGLARALALQPRFVVADEPVSALDVSVRSQVLNLMKRVQASHQLTYLLISHDLSVIRYMADRIAVMYLGKVVEIGTRSAIFDHPAHPYTNALLRSIPAAEVHDGVKRVRSAIRGELPSPRNPPSGCRFRTRCPRAQDICGSVEPSLQPFGGGHVAACHFPLLKTTSMDSE